MNKKLYLLDGHALIYRAYYAFMRRPITNSKGVDTSAIYGFTKTLLEVIRKENPTHIAVAFDPGGKTFRHQMYADYKAHRPAAPEVIKQSCPVIIDIVKAMNIPVLIMPNYEADDVIGTVAKRAEKEGFDVYMITPDKDYGQLVSPHIFICKPQRAGDGMEVLGEKEICEKYTIARPEQVIDILTVMGDASDNVPGVDGVGEVRAKKLIKEFGSVENIYEHLEKLPEKQRLAFEAAREQLPLSKKLVTIDLDVPVPWDEESLVLEKPNTDALKKLFLEYEFASLMPYINLHAVKPAKEAPAEKPAPKAQLSLFDQPETAVVTVNESNYQTIREVEHRYQLVQTAEQLNELLQALQQSSEFCFDTETTGVEPMRSELVGMSFAVKPHEAWYVPIPKERAEAGQLLEKFKSLFIDEKRAKIGQNIKYDILMLKQYGVEVHGFLYDTMLMHYLLEPEGRHNMSVLSKTYLDYAPVEIEELIGKKGAKQGSMSTVPPEQIAEYAAEDADVTLQLKEILEKELHQNNLFELYKTIEAPLVSVLAAMEYEGVAIDVKSLNEYGKTLQQELLKLDEEIKAMAGEPTLNISSPKQLGVILFEKLGLAEKAKLTKTKQYSTDEETLQSLADAHPIIPKILEFRSLRKLLSSYIEALPELVNPRTGRIHTTFNQFVTATGRLSSNNPNLQNIPIRDEKGREIRKAFVPRNDDYVLLSADYSQIELRLMAEMSGDRNMIDAFCSGADIHTATAAKIFHVTPEAVTKEQRSRAKTANFGIIYGISTFGLAQRLQIPRAEAKELIEGYFRTYPDVKKYMETAVEQAHEKGYVTTLFGRVRHLRDINSRNINLRNFAERNAVNAPIQGSAADIIKLAMIRIQEKIRSEKLQSRMLLQVHDELVFDIYKPELEHMKKIVKDAMEHVRKQEVPLIIETGIGKNWLEAH